MFERYCCNNNSKSCIKIKQVVFLFVFFPFLLLMMLRSSDFIKINLDNELFKKGLNVIPSVVGETFIENLF